MGMTMKKRPALGREQLIYLIGIAVAAYLSSYILLLSLPPSVRLSATSVRTSFGIDANYISINGSWEVHPDYHDLPADLFAPVHWLDRTYFRPSKWHGIDPTARQREMDFSWLEPASSPSP